MLLYGLTFFHNIKGALQSVCKQSLCLHFCVQNIELYSTTIYIFKPLEYNKLSKNNNQALQEPKTQLNCLYHKKWAPLCTCADRTVGHLKIILKNSESSCHLTISFPEYACSRVMLWHDSGEIEFILSKRR